MSSIKHFQRIQNATQHLKWLVGNSLIAVRKQDYTWFFDFKDGAWIATESNWRLISPEAIVVTAEDHGHKFGLPQPIDAINRIFALTNGHPLESYEIAGVTSDLTLFFENGASIQFLNLSCGYESWRAGNAVAEVVCLGGGGLSFFEEKK